MSDRKLVFCMSQDKTQGYSSYQLNQSDGGNGKENNSPKEVNEVRFYAFFRRNIFSRLMYLQTFFFLTKLVLFYNINTHKYEQKKKKETSKKKKKKTFESSGSSGNSRPHKRSKTSDKNNNNMKQKSGKVTT